MTRRINTTTQVHAKRTKTGYTITVVGGEFDGEKKFFKEATAISFSPNTKFNLRHVGRHFLRTLAQA